MDVRKNQKVCLKIVENNKEYFDQSIDEIRTLQYLQANGVVEQHNIVGLLDFFYFKEHLFIVAELLEQNLYEHQKSRIRNGKRPQLELARIQKIAKQVLQALAFIHKLHLIHCDLKPENVLFTDDAYQNVKLIDFGSACYTHDNLAQVVQSRLYRAPEVIIGCKYGQPIDIWSLGCLIYELFTGKDVSQPTGQALFLSETIQGHLAKIVGILGPFPSWMIAEGAFVSKYFTREMLIYSIIVLPTLNTRTNKNTLPKDRLRSANKTGQTSSEFTPPNRKLQKKSTAIIMFSLYQLQRLATQDLAFLDFLKGLLAIDFTKRPTAEQALTHPWITNSKYDEGA